MADVGTRCMLSCAHCSSSSGPRGRFASKAWTARLLEYLGGGLVSALQVTGGEPLIFPQMDRIVETCLKNGVEVIVNTNLTVLPPASWRRNSLVRFLVSLDGPDARVHDGVRGGGSFAKTSGNLAMLLSEPGARDRAGLNMVCMRPNQGHARAMVDFAARRDIPLNLGDVWETGRGRNAKLPAGDYFDDLLSAARRAVEIGYDKLRADLPEAARQMAERLTGYRFRTYRCHAGVTRMYFGSSGGLAPCSKTPQESRQVFARLSDAMLSCGFRDFRAAAFGGTRRAAACKGCEYGAYCTPCVYEDDSQPALCEAARQRDRVEA
ncbi:MAG: radical SAM protein [Elusimicrobia bacterium]|nr:radical SAM protein [Elusimicrobiota bacterium]